MANISAEDEANWRSKKYIALSDEEILALATGKLSQRDRVFLLKEIDVRGLEDRLRDAKKEKTRKSMFSKPLWKIIVPIIIGLFFLSRRMFSSM